MMSSKDYDGFPLIPTPTDGVSSPTSQEQLTTERQMIEILKKWGKKGEAVDQYEEWISKLAPDEEEEEEEEENEEETDDDDFNYDARVDRESSVVMNDKTCHDKKTRRNVVREKKMKRKIEIELNRMVHASWLGEQLKTRPSGFVTLDASRPWLLFWAVNSLDILNIQIDSKSRKKCIETIFSFQNPSGGFGGGPGQLSHLAPTYAAILTLCVLTRYETTFDAGDGDGGDGDEERQSLELVWSRVDRKAMYDWFMKVKQADGSFVMHVGGEVDVRGCYCCLVVATLLNIMTPELVKGLEHFIANCQTYEGGLASSAHPLSTITTSSQPLQTKSNPSHPPPPPLGEAHGGYTSCALLCLFLLLPLTSFSNSHTRQMADQEQDQDQQTTMPQQQQQQLNIEAALRWLMQMQGLPVEGGGFRGRTNKLVDGCYGWWCAGLFPIIEALMKYQGLYDGDHCDDGSDESVDEYESELKGSDGGDKDDQQSLYDRAALQEYTLLLAQAPQGGLRDKPGKPADAYHTHYNLAGLSSSQHPMTWSKRLRWERIQQFVVGSAHSDGGGQGHGDGDGSSQQQAPWSVYVYAQALAWKRRPSLVVGVAENELVPVHPCFLVRMERVQMVMDYFYQQGVWE